jgi:hypothetical protein
LKSCSGRPRRLGARRSFAGICGRRCVGGSSPRVFQINREQSDFTLLDWIVAVLVVASMVIFPQLILGLLYQF